MVDSVATMQSTNANPFLSIELNQLEVFEYLIQYISTFWEEDYLDTIYLVTSSPYMMIPLNCYDYLRETFFDDLCELNTAKAQFIPVQECGCSGENYFGIPSMQFKTHFNDEETGFMYNMLADDLMLYPTVSPTLRITVCALAVNSLAEYNKAQRGWSQSESFGFGQVFFRKYGLAMHNVFNSADGSISTTYSFQKGE